MKRILLSALSCLVFVAAQAQWNPFGTGISSSDYVIGITDYEGDLLAYTFPGPQPYVWNGSAWTTPIPPVPNAGGIHKLLVADSVLYAATYATGTYNQFFKYQNGAWVQMGQNFRNWGSSAWASIYDAIVFQDTLYICGEFARHGTDTINYVAKWSGTTWLPVGRGLSQGMQPAANLKYPHQMLIFNNELVVVGNFKKAEGINVNGIARWNGSTWSGFGNGFDRVAYGATVHNNELYVGGEFTLADSHAVQCIAKWDGNTWLDPGFGVGYVNQPGLNLFVHTLLSHQGRLYIVGGFNRVFQGNNSHLGSGIFAWDGALLDTMDGGVDTDMEAIYPYQTGLLVGGGATLAGGTVAVDHIAYYDFLTGTFEPLDVQGLVYPTQFTDGVHVKGNFGQGDTQLQMQLLDMQGRIVHSGLVSPYMAMPSFSAGMYIVQIWKDEEMVYRKLLQKVGL